MNFTCALHLLFMEEEEAFWMLSTIMEHLLPFDYYTSMQGVIIDCQICEKLIAAKLPKLAFHLNALEVSVAPVLHHWFICLFVTVLPLEVPRNVILLYFILLDFTTLLNVKYFEHLKYLPVNYSAKFATTNFISMRYMLN